MSKILVLGPSGVAASQGHQRMRAWLRSLLDEGHEIFVYSEIPCDSPLSGEHSFDLEEVEGRLFADDMPMSEHASEAWAVRIAELAPDVVLAVSLPTALFAALVPIEQPLWIDLLAGVAGANSIAPGKDVFTEWWRLAPMLDRVDLVTCARPEEQPLIVAWLGWRGRFDKNPAAGELVRVAWLSPELEPPYEISEGLKAWWAAPRLAESSFQGTARREHRLLDESGRLTHELHEIHSSKMWTLWMCTIRVRRLLGSPFVWIAAFFSLLGRTSFLVWSGLYLLCGTAWRMLAAGFRRAFKSRRLVAPKASDSLPTRRPRVLIVMPYAIFPPHHGGAVRLFNLVRLLSQDCDLHLLVFIEDDDDPAQRVALEPWVESLSFHPWRAHPKMPTSDLDPPSARLFFDDRVALRIRDLVEKYHLDVVQLEYTELAQYRHAVGETPVILVEHDVSFRSFQRRRRLDLPRRFPASKIYGATLRDWMSLLRYEIAACREVEQLHMMSAEDAEYLAPFLPDSTRRMCVVPNGVDTALYRPPEPAPERRGVLMVGNFHTLPNLDAFEYLMEEIWPALRRLRPDAELSVVGAQMGDRIHQWDGRDGITVVGTVPAMRDAYHRHQVLVVPLRAGSGTRLKLFEAFASGIPSVSTTLGAEGIEYVAGEHLLIADDAESIAGAIDRLLGDPASAAGMAENAQQLAREKYDWSAAARTHLDGIRRLMPTLPAPVVEAKPLAETSPRVFGRSPEGEIVVSVIIPSYRGGEMLKRCLAGLARQECERAFEVLCIDSGSPEEDLATLRDSGARVYGIDKDFFNHGLTRDLGAELAVGEVLVYINQDAVPADKHWLANITAPLFAENPPAAVQGAMVEFPYGTSPVQPFFWGSCGPRFYFTREMHRWVARYPGPSFSTVSAALRRDVWEKIPFGWAPFMEDKKWQRRALEGELRIEAAPGARVFHSHDYGLRSLLRRCQSEGFGWRLLGEHYTFGDMLSDLWMPNMWRELARGIGLRGREMKMAELLFPWLRPVAVWYGNRFLQDVKH